MLHLWQTTPAQRPLLPRIALINVSGRGWGKECQQAQATRPVSRPIDLDQPEGPPRVRPLQVPRPLRGLWSKHLQGALSVNRQGF